jgi:hypothetical protein
VRFKHYKWSEQHLDKIKEELLMLPGSTLGATVLADAVCCLLPAVCCLLSAVCYQLPAACYMISVHSRFYGFPHLEAFFII